MGPWVRLKIAVWGLPVIIPVHRRAHCNSGSLLIFLYSTVCFVFKSWDVVKPQAWLARPPPSVVTKLCPTLCDPRTAAHQSFLSSTVSQSLLKLVSIELVMPSNHLSSPSSASGSFPKSQFFTSGGQSIGALVSALVLPVNIQG